MMERRTLSQKFRYRWDNLMSRGSGTMLLFLGLMTMFMVAGVATLITILGIHPQGSSGQGWLENAWATLMRTLDPGNVSGDLGWPYRLVMLAITLMGIFIISALISILSAGLQVRIEELRKGRSLVVEKNHVVILGWSPKVFTILQELILCNLHRRDACLVILAERDKVVMEDELRLKLPKRGPTRIVCRSGNPTDPHDLELVSPRRAQAIVILAPEGPNPDAETIKTILALTSRPKKSGEAYHIVAELRESENIELARLVGKEEVELVCADDLVARMTVQACRQLGLSLVYSELMDFAGGEMYFHQEPALLGKSYAHCCLSYSHCSVLGLHFASGKVTVNPPRDYILAQGDRVVVLAEDEREIFVTKVPVQAPELPPSVPIIRPSPERVLVLGWNDKTPIILRELDRYMPKGSGLTLVSSYDVGQLFDEQVSMLNNLTAEYWTSSTSDRRVLNGLDLTQFAHVLVLAYSEHLSQQECDSQTLMTLLHVRDICNRESHRLGILSEMLDVRNRELAQVTQADDFVVSDRLVSLIVSQVAHNKHIMRVFDDLFHTEGSEMFLKPAGQYVPLATPVNFYQVVQAGLQRNETAVGFRLKRHEFDPEQRYGLCLNPRKDQAQRFEAGDQIIVLAESEA